MTNAKNIENFNTNWKNNLNVSTLTRVQIQYKLHKLNHCQKYVSIFYQVNFDWCNYCIVKIFIIVIFLMQCILSEEF